jgi:hypothetical protein
MKLLQTLVSAEGFRTEASNAERLGLLQKLIGLARRKSARLLVVPAGFLTAAAEAEVPACISEVSEPATAAGIAVLGGVDVVSPASKRAPGIDELVRDGRLPFFGFAVGPVSLPDGSGHPWRQTSIDNRSAEWVPDDAVPGDGRLAGVQGRRVGVLVCGELFSWRARQGVGRARCDLVVDLGHGGMGQGLIPAMRSVAGEGNCPVVHSQHLSGWYGRSLHFVDRQGEQLSTLVDEDHLVLHGSLWAAWTVREV